MPLILKHLVFLIFVICDVDGTLRRTKVDDVNKIYTCCSSMLIVFTPAA